MNLSDKLDQIHAKSKNNRWMWYFSIFCRVALAAGFLPSGFVKINGERFTALSNNHPMGHYLEALFHTGYYYPFIGVMQMTAAILLLIPRTAVLGAMIYFPIILNICILSLSVRFDGSLISSPLMVLADLYILCWYYDRWKYILPFTKHQTLGNPIRPLSNHFPFKFVAGAALAVLIVGFTVLNIHDLLPRNTYKECTTQCSEANDPVKCEEFCACLHKEGHSLDHCLDIYYDN